MTSASDAHAGRVRKFGGESSREAFARFGRFTAAYLFAVGVGGEAAVVRFAEGGVECRVEAGQVRAGEYEQGRSGDDGRVGGSAGQFHQEAAPGHYGDSEASTVQLLKSAFEFFVGGAGEVGTDERRWDFSRVGEAARAGSEDGDERQLCDGGTGGGDTVARQCEVGGSDPGSEVGCAGGISAGAGGGDGYEFTTVGGCVGDRDGSARGRPALSGGERSSRRLCCREQGAGFVSCATCATEQAEVGFDFKRSVRSVNGSGVGSVEGFGRGFEKGTRSESVSAWSRASDQFGSVGASYMSDVGSRTSGNRARNERRRVRRRQNAVYARYYRQSLADTGQAEEQRSSLSVYQLRQHDMVLAERRLAITGGYAVSSPAGKSGVDEISYGYW